MCTDRKHKPDIQSMNGTSTMNVETSYIVLFLVIPSLYSHENTLHTHNIHYDIHKITSLTSGQSSKIVIYV